MTITVPAWLFWIAMVALWLVLFALILALAHPLLSWLSLWSYERSPWGKRARRKWREEFDREHGR